MLHQSEVQRIGGLHELQQEATSCGGGSISNIFEACNSIHVFVRTPIFCVRTHAVHGNLFIKVLVELSKYFLMHFLRCAGGDGAKMLTTLARWLHRR